MDLDKTKFGSRKALKLPKIVANAVGHKESTIDKMEVGRSVAQAKGKKYVPKAVEQKYKEGIEKNLTLRYDAHELVVITKAKKLASYVITVTAKSPQKFRFTFVNRMHNICLDILESMFLANSLKTTDIRNKFKRKELQHNAFSKLQLLSFVSLLAYEDNCILKKQYEQISLQVSDCINLLVAWTKSTQ